MRRDRSVSLTYQAGVLLDERQPCGQQIKRVLLQSCWSLRSPLLHRIGSAQRETYSVRECHANASCLALGLAEQG